MKFETRSIIHFTIVLEDNMKIIILNFITSIRLIMICR